MQHQHEVQIEINGQQLWAMFIGDEFTEFTDIDENPVQLSFEEQEKALELVESAQNIERGENEIYQYCLDNNLF